ncbi:MAG: hypothetical protein BWX91_00848 [Spirochaetes bacterium ADurb.Bin133]|jgi:hypothetical protein|nr:MAG: hypothetical protein BWX91_00848 [Spirochaetes bacterium ADurb.Bin133]
MNNNKNKKYSQIKFEGNPSVFWGGEMTHMYPLNPR